MTHELLERLLQDPAFRARFQRDPAAAAREAGDPALAARLAADPTRALEALEVRESRSSVAGVMLAAAVEGLGLLALSDQFAEPAHAAVPAPSGDPAGAPRDVAAPADAAPDAMDADAEADPGDAAPDENEPGEEEADENAPDENAPDDEEADENEPDDEEADENEPDENEPDEEEADENEPDEDEPDENEPDEVGPDADDLADDERFDADGDGGDGDDDAAGDPGSGNDSGDSDDDDSGSGSGESGSGDDESGSGSGGDSDNDNDDDDSDNGDDSDGDSDPTDAGGPDDSGDAPPATPVLDGDWHPDPSQYGAAGSGGPRSPFDDAVLHNPRIGLSASARKDFAAGRIDPRIGAILLRIAERHRITLSAASSDHPTNTVGGSPSNHWYGRGVDIASVDGELVRPGSAAARRVAEELGRLDATIRPTEVGSPWPLPIPGSFTDGDHQDHLHVAFDDPVTRGWRPREETHVMRALAR